MTKTVTIRDVARHAGVSVATASRALNGGGLVAEATRRRVLQVVDDLEFTPRVALGRTTIRQRLFQSGRPGAQLPLKEIAQRSDVPISTRTWHQTL